MSLVFQIPSDSTYNECSASLVGVFNVPEPGKYDFNTDTNKNIQIIRCKQNYVYLIERLSIGGSISEDIYLNAIENLVMNNEKIVAGIDINIIECAYDNEMMNKIICILNDFGKYYMKFLKNHSMKLELLNNEDFEVLF